MRKPVERRIIMGIGIVLTLIIILSALLGASIFLYGQSVKPEKSDCIIVLGCQVYGTVPSPFLKSRLEEGLRLYNQGYGSFIIVSGGKGAGEDITEALAMRDYLVSRGVSQSSVIMESDSASTYQNIINSKRVMNNCNLKSAVIVSNSYHLRRISLIAEKESLKASYSGIFVPEYKGKELKGFLREIPALLKYYITGV